MNLEVGIIFIFISSLDVLKLFYFIYRADFFPIKIGKNKETKNKRGEKRIKKKLNKMQFIAARFMRNLFTFSFFKVLRLIDFWPMRTRVLSLFIKTRCCLVVSCAKRTWFIIFSHFIIGQLFMADGLRHLPILFPNSAILLASAKNRSGDAIACVSGLCESFTSRWSVYLMGSLLSWFLIV